MGIFAELMMMNGSSGPAIQDPVQALVSFLFAFVMAQVIAWLYMMTHSGLSYSRAFVQSIVLITLIVCMAMIVIGNNLIVAVGLIGALAVIRFRNILKDTRDTSFIFFALILGMACGTGHYLQAMVGTVFFSSILLYLHWTGFGSRHVSDGFLRFSVEANASIQETLRPLIMAHCRAARLVSQRIGDGGAGEVSYRLILRDPLRSAELVEELKQYEGISNVHFVLQEEQSEV